ncbi:hypothetical protein CDD83_6917 [Cordyceps sp. RAO-2017]|nr:hypothetical protein CDD83_6917 [Cordyceps sp. RAO-2017]
MYTSGSTGKPKGVQITHLAACCAVAALIVAAPAALRRGEGGTRWFQFTTPTFDPSVAEIFIALSVGNTLCACDRSRMLTDPEAAIAELGADSTKITPSIASLLRPERVPSLRYVWCSGETLIPRVIDKFAAAGENPSCNDSRNLINCYGPTEATIDCTFSHVSKKQRGSIIGTALATSSLVILDPSRRSDKPVPVGFSGELATGGPQLSPGYLDRPEQTAKSFVEIAPFGRLYRTGDRARLVEGVNGDLVIDFLGRISSDQIKISGRRIELGEIEAAITGSSVSEAAVVYASIGSPEEAGTSGSGNPKQLIAIVAPRHTSDPATVYKECRDRATSILQPHMRPSTIFMVQKLPRSVSGKIDRKSLQRMCASPRESGMTLLEAGKPDLSPREPANDDADQYHGDEMLRRVVNTVCKTVSVAPNQVTAMATLPSLGLDSLRVVQFLQRAREEGLPSLQFTDVLASSSIAELVERYRQLQGPQSTDSVDSDRDRRWQSLLEGFQKRHSENCIKTLSLNPGDIEAILPATTSQAITLASFLLSSLPSAFNPASSASSKAYIHHSVYEVASDFDLEVLVRAWTSVLNRYDIMRTVFMQVDDDLTPFAQCILSEDSPVARVQPRRYSADDHETFDGMVRKAQADAEKEASLTSPPRNLAVVESPGRSAIILSMHHSIFDGASLQLLLYDVEQEYFRKPAILRSGILTAVKRHFMEDRDEAASFWKSYLENSVFPAFPCIRATLPSEDEGPHGTTTFLSEVEMKGLQEKAARMQSSPLSVLQSAWAVILSTYTGERDVAFANIASDRFNDDLENCSAPALVIHPVRLTLDPQPGVTNMDVTTARTKENAEAFRHLHAPISSASYDTVLAFQQFAGGSGKDVLYRSVSVPAMGNDQAVMVEVYVTVSGKLEFVATPFSTALRRRSLTVNFYLQTSGREDLRHSTLR